MSRNRRIVLICLVICLAISATSILIACKQDTHSVYYEKGNSAATGVEPEAQSYKVGDTVTVADIMFQLDGYEFTGWSDGSKVYQKGDTFSMPESDVTLTAQWKSASVADSYSVRYEKGNSAATGTAPETKTYKAGDTVTVSANTFSLANNEFAGWSDGSNIYQQGDTFTMPGKNVTLTAQWNGVKPDDKPTLAELDGKVYVASNWEYMTNNNGASNDGGDIVYALNDGSVKFHRVNQAVDIGHKLTQASFMLKSTHDFKLWFNSSSKDNATNSSYRLSYEYDELRLSVSTAGDRSAAVVTSTFELGVWNRIDIEFSETQNPDTGRTVCAIKLYVNGERANLSAGENTTQITVEDNTLKHTQVGNFATGTWLVAKVWDACDFFQIKPVAKADVKDVPVIAAIGASITEGAGASNFYTESYPAQLQNELGGAYNVVNFGKSGRTVRTDTGNDTDGTPVPWLQNKQWGGVQAIKPDIAIINMGTNDSKTSNVPATTKENFKAAYNHLLDELLNVNPDMRIIVCTVPYAYSDIYDINNDNIRDIVAPVQREIATEREMELVDLYQITQNKSLLFGDGVHPGTRGYAMFVEVLSKVVRENADSLTTEFLDAIDEKYNDPEYKIENIKASLTAESEQITLTVTGTIEFEDKSYIRLVAEVSDEHERYQSITLNPDGTFSVSMRIDDLTSNEWYIIRIYLTESFSYVVMLNDTDHAEGDVVSTTARKATVVSWSNRFNLKIEDNNYVNLTNSAITTTDGVKLTLTGTTNVDSLRLFVGVNPGGTDWKEYVDVTLTDSAFTVTYDLGKLFDGAEIVSNYVNVRLYYGDTSSYFVVPLAMTTIDGQPAATGASFHTEDKTVTIVSWTDSGTGTLSFTVAEYNPLAPSIEVTQLAFDEGYLTITGTANEAVETLRLYLYNTKENIETYFTDVTIGDNGAFTAQIGLAQLTIADNEWYYLWSSINGGDKQNVKYVHDTLIVHQFENRVYKFTGWDGNVAIVYTTQTVSENTVTLTSVTVTEQDAKINLTVVGTTNDNGIRLYVGADPADTSKYNHYEDITVGDNGEFTVTFDLATCPVGGWYNIRLYFTDNEYYAVSYEEAVNASGVALKTEDTFYSTDKSVTVKSWNDKGGLVKTFSIEVKEYDSSYTVTATSITFDNQYLVVAGTATGNINKLVLALHNDNNMQDNIRVDVTVTENAFEARLDLTKITLPQNSWLYLWSSVNDGDDAKVVYAKNDTKHVYENRQYRFEYWEGIAIAYSDYTPPAPADESFSVTDMRFVDGKFIVEGTCGNGVTELVLHLHNTNSPVFDVTFAAAVNNERFIAEILLSDIKYANGNAAPANYINVRYQVNDKEFASSNNILPGTNGDYSVGQQYSYEDKTWTLAADNSRTYLKWSANSEFQLSEIKLELVDSKPTLIIAGTALGSFATLEAAKIQIRLDKTAGTKEQKNIDNIETEAGQFRFEIDLTDLIASTVTTESKEECYFLRLMLDGTPKNINSPWASDIMWEKGQIDTVTATYFFTKNSDRTATTWYTLGVAKIEKDITKATKLGDIDDMALNYYAKNSKAVDLSEYVSANGTAVTYNVTVADPSLVTALITNGTLTVTANGLSGMTTVTVEVLSDGARAFDLQFDVTLDDSTITKTNNYASFLTADSWKDIVGDGNDRPWLDGVTNSMILQWGNVYQEIGVTSHISFELWVNAGGDFGFEIWFRSTTNDKAVTGNKYVFNGYNNPMTISREDGTVLGSLPRFDAGQFTRFDITMLDVYDGDNAVKTLINVYMNGTKVQLTGNSVSNGTIVDNAPIAASAGIYFALKSWNPQIAIRTTTEKVAAVGDSITYGHSWHNESYPVYLASELGGDYNVGNFGLNGASVTGYGGSSLKYSAQQQYTDSVNFAPDVIVIMLGANDANGWANASASYESELRALITSYKTACPDAAILLVTSAPTLDNNQFGIPNDAIKNDVNPIQRSVAEDMGLTLVDLRAQMEAAEGGYNGFFREDGVHLSVAGAQFVANVIGNAIKALG